ncbi:MAG: hypothetical protein BGO77_06985 [Caedibacter sp. 37-49]|nr:MAG: hypothetical protein BGO77_06985 [Caedibacter sp. 37-49]
MTPYTKPNFAVNNQPTTPLGFTWIHEFKIENRPLIILGASDNLSAMVFDGKTKKFHQFLLPSGPQIWSVDEIYRPFIESLAIAAIKKFDALIEKVSWECFRSLYSKFYKSYN